MKFVSVCFVVILYCCSGNAYECKPSAAPPDPKSGCCGKAVGVEKSISGSYAQLGEYPWVGIVLKYAEDELKLACSAVLISGRYMLSAAHCFKDVDIGKTTTISLGEYNTTNNGPDCVEVGGIKKCNDSALKILIEKVIIHPEYNREESYQHDIALIRLAEIAPQTDFIQPICLPTFDITAAPINERLWAAGWGVPDDSKLGISERIRHVDLPYVDLKTCQSAFDTSKMSKTKLGSGQLCAGGEKGKDTCKGDGGAPLMYKREDITELAGIVSFGSNRCGQEGKPSVYTKVFAYDAWIRANIEP